MWPLLRDLRRSAPARWIDAGVAAGVAILALCLFVPRLLPGTGYHPDTIKYQFVGAVLGGVHPPGSPLYILLNWCAAQVPVGELAWRVNLLSALAGALCCALLYLLARALGASRIASIAGAAILAVSPIFWSQSLVAEVYTPHGVLALLSTLILIRWDGRRCDRDLLIAALAFGFSFGVHTMSVVFVPGWLIVLWARRGELQARPRLLAYLVIGAAAGMATYLYYAIVPATNPVYLEEKIRDARGFFTFVFGGYFRRRMFAFGPGEFLARRLPWLLDVTLAQTGFLVLSLALVGFVALARRCVRWAAFLAMGALLGCVFAMGYAVGDADNYLLPAVYGLSAAAAVGLTAISNGLGRMLRRPRLAALVALALVAGVAAERRADVMAAAATLDRSSDIRWAEYGRAFVASAPPRAMILSSDQWAFFSIGYRLWGLGERQRDGVTVHAVRRNDCAYLEGVIRHRSAGRPVVATGELEGCLRSAGIAFAARDLSRRFPDWLGALPAGRMVLAAAADEATAGLSDADWEALQALGYYGGMRGGFRWSHVAATVTTGEGLRGVARSGPGRVELRLHRGDGLWRDLNTPFELVLSSGGQLSGAPTSVRAAGVEYARPMRGLHVAVFDLRTGAPIERQLFDLHRTTSLRDALALDLRAP